MMPAQPIEVSSPPAVEQDLQPAMAVPAEEPANLVADAVEEEAAHHASLASALESTVASKDVLPAQDTVSASGHLTEQPLTMALPMAAELAEPVAGVPEAIGPEAIVSETIGPEAVVPESTVPEAVVPEAIVSEATVPEAIVPEIHQDAHGTPVHPSPADIFKSSFSIGADDDDEFELSEPQEPAAVQASPEPQVLEPAAVAESAQALEQPALTPHAAEPAQAPEHIQAAEPMPTIEPAQAVVPPHVFEASQTHVPTMSAADISTAEQDDQFTMPDLEPSPQPGSDEQAAQILPQPDVFSHVETTQALASEHDSPVSGQTPPAQPVDQNASPQSGFSFLAGGQSAASSVSPLAPPPTPAPSQPKLDDFWSQPVEAVKALVSEPAATPSAEPVHVPVEEATVKNADTQEQFDHAPMQSQQSVQESAASTTPEVTEQPAPTVAPASSPSGILGQLANIQRSNDSGQFSSLMTNQIAQEAVPVAPAEVETSPAPAEPVAPKNRVFIGFSDEAVPVAPPEPVKPPARVYIGYSDEAVPVAQWEPSALADETPEVVQKQESATPTQSLEAPAVVELAAEPAVISQPVPDLSVAAQPAAELAAPAMTAPEIAVPEPILAEPPVSAPQEVVPAAPVASSTPVALPSGDELMSMGLDELQAMAELLLRGVKTGGTPALPAQPAPAAEQSQPALASFVPTEAPVAVPIEPVLETPIAPPPAAKSDGLKSLAEKLAEAKLSLFDDLDIGWTGNTGTHAQIQSEPSQRLLPEPDPATSAPAIAESHEPVPMSKPVTESVAHHSVNVTAEPYTASQPVVAPAEPEVAPEVPYVEPRAVSAAEELATLFSNTPIVPSTPSVPVSTQESASLSHLLDELKDVSVPSDGSSIDTFAGAPAETSLATPDSSFSQDDSSSKPHLHAGADAAANVKASSLFGDDDDLDDEIMAAEPPAHEAPMNDTNNPSDLPPASNPSAELAALFDTVMDEGSRNPERISGTEIPEPTTAASVDPHRAAFLSELRALEELMPPESALPAPSAPTASHANFVQELGDVAAREAEIQRSRFEAELLALDDDEPAEVSEPVAEPTIKKMPSFADLLKDTGTTNGGHDEPSEQAVPTNGGAHAAEPDVVPAQEAFNQYMRRNQFTQAQPAEADAASGFAPAPSAPSVAPSAAPPAEPAPRKVGRAWPSLPVVPRSAPAEPAVVAETPASQPVSAASVPAPSHFSPAPAPSTTASASEEEESPIMDLERLEKICGVEGMRDIIAEFVVSSQQVVDRLEASITSRNDEVRRAASNELTGSCSALGAKQLQEMAMAMLMVPGDDWELSQALLVHLKDAHNTLKASLLPLLS